MVPADRSRCRIPQQQEVHREVTALPTSTGAAGDQEAAAHEGTDQGLTDAARRRTFALFIGCSVTAVLGFALFQHMVVLQIPFAEIKPPILIVPTVVGGVFGYLLAKVRILHLRSRYQLELITERDRQLQQEIDVRKRIERSLREQRQSLEVANEELKSFSYSVSHDLRGPLRTLSGFSHALADDYSDSLDEMGKHYLSRIQSGCRRMEEMIDCLLTLSRVSRADIVLESVDLSSVAGEILHELAEQYPERHVEIEITPDLRVEGDRRLLMVVLENLFSNAWKFTAGKEGARIQFLREEQDGQQVLCVRDNGAGFDMEYARKLFVPFSRLHQQEEFPGSGIGLATVQRALVRQGGRIWAKGKVGQGACFCFTL